MTAPIIHLHHPRRQWWRRALDWLLGIALCAGTAIFCVLVWYGAWVLSGAGPGWFTFALGAGVCALVLAALWLGGDV